MLTTERHLFRRWLTFILLSLMMLLLGAWYSWDVTRFVASLALMPDVIVFYKGLQYLPGLVIGLAVAVCAVAYPLVAVAGRSRGLRYCVNVGVFIGLVVFFGWPQFTAGKVHRALQMQGYRYCAVLSGRWPPMQAQVYIPSKARCPASLEGV